MVQVFWCGLPESKDTLKPLQKVIQDVPFLQKRPLCRKKTPASLVSKVLEALPL